MLNSKRPTGALLTIWTTRLPVVVACFAESMATAEIECPPPEREAVSMASDHPASANAGFRKFAATSGRAPEVVVMPARSPSTRTCTRTPAAPSSQSAAHPLTISGAPLAAVDRPRELSTNSRAPSGGWFGALSGAVTVAIGSTSAGLAEQADTRSAAAQRKRLAVDMAAPPRYLAEEMLRRNDTRHTE